MSKSRIKYLLLLFLFAVSTIVNSQDTLFLKPAGKLVVIVKEVSQTEIRYKKPEIPDGAMYIINKSDVQKIRYHSGYVEILAAASPPSQIFLQDKPFTIKSEAPAINTEKITLEQAKRNQYVLMKLINTHPDPARKEPLTKINLRIQSLKKKERGATFSAVVVSGIAAGGFLLYSGGMNVMSIDADDLLIPPLIISGVAAILGATAVSIHISVRKKQKKFVKLYNE